MPVQPEKLLKIAQTTSWEKVSKMGRHLDERVKSAKALQVIPEKTAVQYVWNSILQICENFNSFSLLLLETKLQFK